MQPRANILLCEDDPDITGLVKILVEGLGHRLTAVYSARDLLAAARAEPPDLIILDVLLSGTNGFEVAQELQRDPALSSAPIIFLTALSSKEDVAHGLQLGAVDYVVKPFENLEFAARIQVALRVKFQIDRLRRANAELSELALIDPLTGIYNRRFLMARLAQGVAQARRYKEAIACVLFDLDGFKRANDQHGHLQGDLLLQDVAALLTRQVRSSDTCGRYGGDEFVVVCPQTDGSQVMVLANRIRVAMEAHEFPGPGDRPLRLTASIGTASFDPQRDESGEALLARADQAMYRAKGSGGNQISSD